MSPIDVAGHLDERFRLLTGKRRGRVERHQTLRATVEWSYQLLGDDERMVFDRLGMFAGAFDAAAAIAVASGDELDAWTVTDALASLVAKSMLGTETGPDGTTRYAMLETLRQYARERLDETAGHGPVAGAPWRGTSPWSRGKPATACMGPDDLLWLARIRADVDNIRAAIGWALDSDDPADQELGLSILASLEWIGGSASDLGLDALAVVARAAGRAIGAPPAHTGADPRRIRPLARRRHRRGAPPRRARVRRRDHHDDHQPTEPAHGLGDVRVDGRQPRRGRSSWPMRHAPTSTPSASSKPRAPLRGFRPSRRWPDESTRRGPTATGRSGWRSESATRPPHRGTAR